MLAHTEYTPLWIIAAVVLAVVAMLAIVIALPWSLRRGRRVDLSAVAPLKVNVSALPAEGPPEVGAGLRIYNVPVRCAMLVLAPVGRGAAQPTAEAVGEIVDQIVPGLSTVAAAHGTAIKIWPAQLSSQGFLHQFSLNVGLPGDGGKGTPWSSVCGRFEAHGAPYLAGLLLCASRANGLGQFLVERESQWPDMLRVEEAK